MAAVNPFDYNLMFKSDSANLTKTGLCPTAGIKIYGTPVKGHSVRILYPSTPGLSATLLPEIHMSEDDSTYHLVSTYPGGALSWASGAKEIAFSFQVPQRKNMYVKLNHTIGGGTTATSFGAMKAGLVLAGAEWDRSVDFTR